MLNIKFSPQLRGQIISFIAFTFLSSLLFYGCQKTKEVLPKPSDVHREVQQPSITIAEFDEVLNLLSKGFIDLLKDPSFVQNTLYSSVNPCGGTPIDAGFLGTECVGHLPSGGTYTSTIKEQMNKAIEKYAEVEIGQDHVTKLLSKFTVNNVEYVPFIEIPNFDVHKLTNKLPLVAPAVGYETEGISGDFIKAWKNHDGNELEQVSIYEGGAEETPIVIVGNASIDYINDPCGVIHHTGGGSGTASGSGTGNTERLIKGIGIDGTGDPNASIINVRMSDLKVTDVFEGWQDRPNSEVNYKITLFGDPTIQGNGDIEDLANAHGNHITKVHKNSILGGLSIPVNDTLIQNWPTNVPYLAITVFEYDWYASPKHNDFSGQNGLELTHWYKARFEGEIFYTNLIESTNNMFLGGVFPDLNLNYASFGNTTSMCSSCTPDITCFSGIMQGCQDNFFLTQAFQ